MWYNIYMNTLTKILITLAIALILFAIAYNKVNYGQSTSGLSATVATTTLSRTIGTSQSLLVASSTCTSRVISTTNGAVYLTFSDIQGIVPTATTGHLQLGSTTVVYDSGLYGCGAIRAISATGGNVVVSVSEAI